jgi:hypothetical protein
MITISIQHVISQRLWATAVFLKATGVALSSLVGAKRRWLALLLFHLLILPTTLCAAASQQIQVTWAYSGANADLVGFRLYQDASLVYESNDPEARTLTCTVDLGSAPAHFTLTAFDVYGSESSPSPQKIISPNDLAVAFAASFSTTVNTEVGGSLEASDPQGFDLVYTITSQAQNGTAMLLDPATGAFVYTPREGFTGTDTFSFKASGNGLDSNVATVSITVTTTQRLSAQAVPTLSPFADTGGGGGGGCNLAAGHRSPNQAADWLLLGGCFVWLAVRKLQRR